MCTARGSYIGDFNGQGRVMAKAGERTYFKEIGQAGADFTPAKPFSDLANIGSLLSNIVDVFTLLLQPSSKILDLGCGWGWASNFYAQTGYDVTGVDVSKDAVHAAKHHLVKPGLKLAFKQADYDELKYKNEFGAVVEKRGVNERDHGLVVVSK